jgi:hypothetical protein
MDGKIEQHVCIKFCVKPVECHLKINVQGDQAPAKPQKMLKKFKKSSTKTVAEQFMSSQTPFG